MKVLIGDVELEITKKQFDDYEKLTPIKDWSTERAGGPRKVIREDVQE